MAEAEFFADESTLTLVRRRRRFTLIEANRTLPLVKRIASDVVRTHATARTLHAQLARKLPRVDRQRVESELDSVVHRLQGYVDELTEVGAELKDYQSGLLDFVSVHQGRDVYLCWRLGEDHIGHWHELDAGFQGRQPVSVLQQ